MTEKKKGFLGNLINRMIKYSNAPTHGFHPDGTNMMSFPDGVSISEQPDDTRVVAAIVGDERFLIPSANGELFAVSVEEAEAALRAAGVKVTEKALHEYAAQMANVASINGWDTKTLDNFDPDTASEFRRIVDEANTSERYKPFI